VGDAVRQWTVTAGAGGGLAEIVAAAETAQAALEAALWGVIEAILGEADPAADPPGTAAPLRATGSDHAGVFARLADALIGEIETADRQVRAVRVDGLLRRDERLLAWGYAFFDDAAPSGRAVGALEAIEVLEAEQDRVEIRATLRR